jgi:hypothetical protein
VLERGSLDMPDKRTRRRIIVKAFHPAIAIRDAELFAGRTQQIRQIIEALHMDGQCVAIHGDRGVGKTSLAWQAWFLSMGEDKLLRDHALGDWAIPHDETYVPFYVACSDQTPDVEAILKRVCVLIAHYMASFPDEHAMADRSIRQKVSFKFFEHETTSTLYGKPKGPLLDPTLGTEEQFHVLVQQLKDATGDRVLIILDELDRVGSLSGLASFVRSFSSETIKFILVGCARDVADLIGEHRSIERIVAPVALPRMRAQELMKIVTRATIALHQSGLIFQFTERFVQKLVSIAGGFPWLVHLVCHDALMRAEDDGRLVLTEDDVALAVNGLTAGRLAPSFKVRYDQAVGNSKNREYLLRCLAHHPQLDIPADQVYELLRMNFAIVKPGKLRAQLTTEKYGDVLRPYPEHYQAFIQFSDELFRRFVILAPSRFPDVKDEVKIAYDPTLAVKD